MRVLSNQEVRMVSGGSYLGNLARTLDVRGSTVSECQAARQWGDSGWIWEITQSSEMVNGVEVITVTATMTGHNVDGTYTNGTLVFKNQAAYERYRREHNFEKLAELFISGTATGVTGGGMLGPAGAAAGALLGGSIFVIGGAFMGQFE